MDKPQIDRNRGAVNSFPVSQDRIARKDGRPQRNQPLLRSYEVAHLTKSGELNTFHKLAPAIPMFENAFSAFARDLIVQTTHGPSSVEDLFPGDTIRDADGNEQKLVWKGSMTVVPQENQTKHLVRITADSFGIQGQRLAHFMELFPQVHVWSDFGRPVTRMLSAA